MSQELLRKEPRSPQWLRITVGSRKRGWGTLWGRSRKTWGPDRAQTKALWLVHTVARKTRAKYPRGAGGTQDLGRDTVSLSPVTRLPLPRAPRAGPAGIAPDSARGPALPSVFPPGSPGHGPLALSCLRAAPAPAPRCLRSVRLCSPPPARPSGPAALAPGLAPSAHPLTPPAISGSTRK